MRKWGKEFGDIYGFYGMTWGPGLIVNDPMLIKEVNVKKFSKFTTRGRWKFERAFGKMTPKFITVREGPAWKRQGLNFDPPRGSRKCSYSASVIGNGPGFSGFLFYSYIASYI